MLQDIPVNSPIRDGAPVGRSTVHNFSPQQLAILETWKSSRKEWNVHLVDNPSVGTEMIVIELPPYLDIDGLGLNLRNWVIYPLAAERVRVLFWDDIESHYSTLRLALKDIANLRAANS
jgi:hypothetical protein